MTNPQTISDGKVVTIHYKLTLDNGTVVDSSEGQDPLAYLHGTGSIVSGLESALEGRSAGDSFNVKVAPEDGYGQRSPDAVQVVARDVFPEDAKLEPGISFHAMDENQQALIGTITAVEGEKITVDFNHPMAGLNLNFEIEVTEIRDATDEEKEHGHVHGSGGHEH